MVGSLRSAHPTTVISSAGDYGPGFAGTTKGALFSSYCIAIDVMETRHISVVQRRPCDPQSMIRKSGSRFSDKIMLKQKRPFLRRISMSLDSDVIVDRRRIRRKLTFWRVVAALIAIAAIVTVGVIVTPGGRGAFTASGSIARIQIDGLIRSDNDRVEALERLEKSRAAAVIVHINSPGGTTAGSEQLYDALVRLKAKKPVVVVVAGLAAAGGLITALLARPIITPPR